MPHRSICSSQNFERQPGEIPCKPSLCSHRNSLPLTFAWDQLNHAIWSYFPFQLYTSRLHTSNRIIRDKQASTFPSSGPWVHGWRILFNLVVSAGATLVSKSNGQHQQDQKWLLCNCSFTDIFKDNICYSLQKIIHKNPALMASWQHNYLNFLYRQSRSLVTV